MKALLPIVFCLAIAGCIKKPVETPTAPVPPPTAEEIARQNVRRCNVATTLVSSGKLGAAWAMPADVDPKIRDTVDAAIVGADTAAADFCDAVMAGGDPDAEAAAWRGLRAALDRLTALTLAPKTAP